MKKLLSIILALLMVVTMIPFTPLALAADTVTVYFKNTAGWKSTMYAFCWKDNSDVQPLGSWPGTLMDEVEGESQLYAIDVPTDIYAVIFNDGGLNQTPDLFLPTDGANCYDNGSGQWSKLAAEGDITYYALKLTEAKMMVNDSEVNGYDYGFEEYPEYAFDNDPYTKLCLLYGGEYLFDHSGLYYCVIAETETGAELPITQYTFTTANDSSERDPDDWKVYGSNDKLTWQLIDEVTDAAITDERLTDVDIKLETATESYRYFKFEFTGIKGKTDVFQIADIKLASEGLHTHEGATQTCKGYKCTVCGSWYGEIGTHVGGTQTCKGYKCDACGEWYGEKGDHIDYSEQTCKGYYCNDCYMWFGEADLTKHSWFYGSCDICGEDLPENYMCEPHNWNHGTCTVCGIECSHEEVVDGVCTNCSRTTPFRLEADGNTSYYNSFADAYSSAEEGSIISLMTDYEDYNTVTIDKEITLDLNGHKWEQPSSGQWHVRADATFTDSVGGGYLGYSLYIYTECTISGGSYRYIDYAGGKLGDLIGICYDYYDCDSGELLELDNSDNSGGSVTVKSEHTQGVQDCGGYVCTVCNEHYGQGVGEHFYEGDITCLGYKCGVCGQYSGADGSGAHTGGTQTCKGYKCELCNSWYGEPLENAHNNENGDDFCDRCEAFIGDEIKVGNTYTIDREKHVKFVPAVDGVFVVRSESNVDPVVFLLDSEFDDLDEADDSYYREDNSYDFYLEYEYKAGETYYFNFYGYGGEYNYSVIFECNEHQGGKATCNGRAVCSACGEEYGEVDVSNHNWANNDGICANGCGYECPHEKYTMGICDECNYLCPHSFTEFNETVAPKCEETGWEESYCDYCNIRLEQEVPALGHDWVSGGVERPTQNKDGSWSDGYYYDTCQNDVSHINKTGVAKRGDYDTFNALFAQVKGYQTNADLTNEAVAKANTVINSNWMFITGYIPQNLIENELNVYIGQFKPVAEAIEAGIADGTMLKADYTAIDEAIKAVDEALENATISEEMKAELEDIKADLEALKENADATMADVNELLDRAEAITETMNNCANGVHSFTTYEEEAAPECGVAGKETATCDNGCGATDEKEIDALTHSDGKDMDDGMCDECGDFIGDVINVGEKLSVTTRYSVRNYVTFTPKKSGEYVIVSRSADLYPEVTLYSENWAMLDSANAFTGGGNNFRLSYNFEAGKTYILSLYDYTGADEVTFDIEIITPCTEHKGGEATCMEKARCEVCYELYGETAEHSFTQYYEEVAPECGKIGVGVAYCDYDCGEADEKDIPALTHVDDDGDGFCDNDCGTQISGGGDGGTGEPETPDEPTDDTCDHLCHKDGILGFFWKIIRFLQKLFGIQQYCDCGVTHW